MPNVEPEKNYYYEYECKRCKVVFTIGMFGTFPNDPVGGAALQVEIRKTVESGCGPDRIHKCKDGYGRACFVGFGTQPLNPESEPENG